MKFTADIEIPKLVLSINFEAESFEDAVGKANFIHPVAFIKTIKNATIMDSDNPRLVGLLSQE